MSKNVIFQYMITSKEVDKRGGIKGWDGSRSSLYEEVAKISRESFEKYAERIDATHIYSNKRVATEGHGCSTSLLHECARVWLDPIFDQYDNLLFADTDIVVNTDENIFDLMESGADVYGVLESDFVTASGGGYNSWDGPGDTYDNFCRKFSLHDCPIVPVMPPNRPSKITIMNTGVVLWTKEARLRARELFLPWEEWCYSGDFHMSIMNDQPYISAQLMKHDFDIETIDQTWNDSPHYASEEEFFQKARFCHYTGGEWKVDMVRHWNDRRYNTQREGDETKFTRALFP
jgi:hypothetical protein